MNEEDTYELFQRGCELMLQGHDHQAAIVLRRAVEQEPEKASIHEQLARALFNSRQTGEAAREFSRTIELDPANHYAHFGLGLCKARLGDRAKAVGLLKIALAMRPDLEDYRNALRRLAS